MKMFAASQFAPHLFAGQTREAINYMFALRKIYLIWTYLFRLQTWVSRKSRFLGGKKSPCENVEDSHPSFKENSRFLGWEKTAGM